MSVGANGLADLEKRFAGRGYTFRHFENAKVEILRFQAGRIDTERRVVPSEIVTGHRAVELRVEVFCLIACAATADELTERLEQLPSIAPAPHRELLE